MFNRETRRVSKSYENEQVINAIHTSEVDKGIFWKMVKGCRSNKLSSIPAIKNKSGKVVYSMIDILETTLFGSVLPKGGS